MAYALDSDLCSKLERLDNLDWEGHDYRRILNEFHEAQTNYLAMTEAIASECLEERADRSYRYGRRQHGVGGRRRRGAGCLFQRMAVLGHLG